MSIDLSYSIIKVSLLSRDLSLLDSYVRVHDLRNTGGNLLSRNQAIYSIVKSFIEEIRVDE